LNIGDVAGPNNTQGRTQVAQSALGLV